MKKYSSKRAKKGRVAYRTPSMFRYKKYQEDIKLKLRRK